MDLVGLREYSKEKTECCLPFTENLVITQIYLYAKCDQYNGKYNQVTWFSCSEAFLQC